MVLSLHHLSARLLIPNAVAVNIHSCSSSSSSFYSNTPERLRTVRTRFFSFFNPFFNGNHQAFHSSVAATGSKNDSFMEYKTRLTPMMKNRLYSCCRHGISTKFLAKPQNFRLFATTAVANSEQCLTKDTPEQLFPPKSLHSEVTDDLCTQLQLQCATAVYVHLPFCRRRCHYCDFPIIPVGELINSRHVSERMEDYVTLLCKEITIAASSFHSSTRIEKQHKTSWSSIPESETGTDRKNQLRTVFFGGGTPSLIPPVLLEKVLNCLRNNFGSFAPDAEISMEMDPGTFDEEKLKSFLDAGINRVSLGVQSFQSNLLKACGRAHGLTEIDFAIKTLQGAGVRNWSMDLISSLPGQTMADWRDSLEKAIATEPNHISVYDLQIEEGTAFGRWYQPGQKPLPSDDMSAEMFQTASSILRSAGYGHYEISNYSKPGFECRHNLVYWQNQPYFGFGLGSTSYVDSQRFSRPKKLGEYAKWVTEYETRGGNIDWPKDSPEDLLFDGLMLGLRLANGIEVEKIKTTFGEGTLVDVVHGLLESARLGNVLFLDKSGSLVSSQEALLEIDSRIINPRICRIRLSDPDGFMLSNDVIAGLFSTLPKE